MGIDFSKTPVQPQNNPDNRPNVQDVTENPKEPGETLHSIEDYMTPLGVEILINHVGDCFD